MQRRNCNFRFEKDIENLENRYDKFCIKLQKKITEEEGKQQTGKLKVIEDELYEIVTYKKIRKYDKQKPSINSKDDVDKFEENKFEK